MSNLGSTLADSVNSESTTDLLVIIGDTGLDAAIASGAFDGVPVFGTATGLWRAGKEIHQNLFIRKVIRFLSEIGKVHSDKKRIFVENLDRDRKKEEFGETILLILERIDDTIKPGLVGRVMAAHLRGQIEYERAMRLSAMIGRCHSSDLKFLKTFQPGPQGDLTSVAESLFVAGLLSQAGTYGGTVDGASAGMRYVLNEFGELLLKHALV